MDCKKTGNWTGLDWTGLEKTRLQLPKNIHFKRLIKDQLQLVATGLFTLINRADISD